MRYVRMTTCSPNQEIFLALDLARSYGWRTTRLKKPFNGYAAKELIYSIHDRIWTISAQWEVFKTKLLQSWNKGKHHFSPLKRYRNAYKSVAVFEAEDALLLKSLQLSLSPQVTSSVSERIYHLKGRGGTKALLRDTMKALPNYKYVFKSDVKSFYDSIDHNILVTSGRSLKLHPNIIRLMKQSLYRVEECNTHYQDFQKGIPRGSPLSPLLGTFMLRDLDNTMEKIPGVYYGRYMDDWVVLCNTRSTLRKIIKFTHRLMHCLKLELHPDKTYFGRIEKGFDFLGYRLSTNRYLSTTPPYTTLEHNCSSVTRKRIHPKNSLVMFDDLRNGVMLA